MRKTTSLIILGCFLKMMVYAASNDEALERLRKVNCFSFGGVSVGGEIPQRERDFFEIFKRKSAVADLEKLFKIGTPEAKCYAFSGLFMLDKEKFNKIDQSFLDRAKVVVMMSGCIVSVDAIDSVIETIGKGGYAWYFEYKKPEKQINRPEICDFFDLNSGEIR